MKNEKKSTKLDESCKHAFGKPVGVCGLNLCWRCSTCGERVERRMTADERRAWAAYRKQEGKDLKALHGPYSAFCKRFKGEGDTWQLSGYEFMQAVEKWSIKYPDRVYCVPCDDTYFSNSLLVLITHEVPGRHWMGITVVAISQCDGLPPKEFFLYPNHAEFLMRALTSMQPRMKLLKDRKWPFVKSRYEAKKTVK